MKVRQIACVLIVVCATATSALAQGTGGGGGGTGGGGAGGGAAPGGGNTGGGTAIGGNTGGNDTGSGSANVSDSTDDSALAQAIVNSQQVDTDKVIQLRERGVGRVGIVNNFSAGSSADDTSGASSTGSAGSVGAGVRYRNSQGQSRFNASTSTSRTGTGATGGGTGRTGGGAIGGGNTGLNNAFGNTGTVGSLNSTAALRIPVAFMGGAKELLARAATPESSRLVSTRIRSLPAISQLQQAEVHVNGRIATIRGSVSSQAEKDRIARMVRMAKGVDSVVNEIVVNEDSSPSDRQTPRL